MASIDCMKCTSGQVGGLSVHFDYDKRLECEHENPHIDKSKTHLNSFYDCAGYPEMLHRQKKRVAEVDVLHPPERFRKDRITAIMMEIPVPRVISDKGLTDQFLQDTYAMIGEMCGKANMCGMTIHRDEVHDYIDHGGKTRTSLEHGHAMVVPYARWTAKETVYGEDGKPLRDKTEKIVKQDVKREGVNAKHFLTRSFLKKLQDRMQEMVLEKYGISYQTSQEPLHMTVEDLKRESGRAAAIIGKAEQHAEELQEQLGVVRNEVAEATKEAAFQNQLADAEAARAARERQKAEDARQRALNADAQADAAAKRTKALEGKIGALEPKLKEQTALYEELHRANAANVKIIDENAAIIQEQEATLGLIQDYEEYCAVADLTDADLELGERMLQKLPAPKGVFKTAEQKGWLRDMKTMFEKLLFAIGEGIRRLRIFESRHEVPEKRSEPAQERAVAFGDKLADAFARAEEGASKGHRSRQKDGPSWG